MMTINYRESYGLHASSGILFNHESPRRGLEFVTRKISSTVAKIHYRLENKLLIGNLDSKRDWGFAGDYVEAMWLMLQQEEPSDYVISTGKVFSVKDFIQLAFSKVGIENWEKYVHVDSSLFRPAEVDFLLGDSSKAKKVLGWEPKIQFEGLVQLMVESDLKLYKPQ
jgi:GDPmannose 4,6-dehydratase